MSDKKRSTKKQEITDSKNTATIAKAGAVKLEPALEAVGKANIVISGTLSKISEEMVAKHNQLTAMNEAYELRQQQVRDLNLKIEMELTVDELRVAHEAEVAELKKAREAIKQENLDLEEELRITREREDADFQYNLALDRKKAHDAWLEEVRVQENQQRDKLEAMEKAWALREGDLVTREKAYQEAIAKLATFDAEVKKLAAEDTYRITHAQKLNYDHATQIAAIETKATITSLEKDIAAGVALAEQLRADLTATRLELQKSYEAQTALATKSVDGAVQRQAQVEAMAVYTNTAGSNGGRPSAKG